MALSRRSAPSRTSSPTSPASSIRSHSPSTSQPEYATLAPRNVNVSRSKILKKWKPLPQQTQDRIRGVLSDVKNESKARRRKALPRNVNGKNTTREILSEEEWEVIVDDLVAKLISRLPRMPFPPIKATKSSSSAPSTATCTDLSLNFSLEPLVIRTSYLRSILSSTQQSSKLLQAQIKREEAELKRDMAELKTLEEGVRRGRESAARQSKSLHPITRPLEHQDASHIQDSRTAVDGGFNYYDDDNETMLDTLILTTARTRTKKKHISLTASTLEEDPDLAPLVKQLRSHLNSMQSNVSSLQPVKRDLARVEGDLLRLTSRLGA